MIYAHRAKYLDTFTQFAGAKLLLFFELTKFFCRKLLIIHNLRLISGIYLGVY